MTSPSVMTPQSLVAFSSTVRDGRIPSATA